jgi:hypothetical protein
MTVQTRIEPIDRDIALMLSEELSPQGQSKVFAEFAGEQIEDAKQTNRQILGRMPRYTVAVDGRAGAPLETVKPDGVISAEFELFDDVLVWIADQLEKHSPRLTGKYAMSHTVFADGVEVDVGAKIPDAQEIVFISTLPYARKIERGESSQAPDGVYQVVATLAQRRFGNIAKVTFSYRTALSGSLIGGRAGDRSSERNPAIIVRLPR